MGDDTKPPKVHDYSPLTPYTPVEGTPLLVLVDLDGTAALHNGRDPYREELAGGDLPNRAVIRTALALAKDGVKIMFLSGRTDGCRDITEQWLHEHFGAAFEGLHMRAAGDTRTDWRVKAELFDRHVRDQYDVLMVMDDRNQVVGMWRHIGLTVFQVAEGNF